MSDDVVEHIELDDDEDDESIIVENAKVALAVRDRGAYGRAMSGKGPLDVTVCLGKPRCMFPSQGWEERVCSFCLRIAPNEHAKEATERARRFMKGN